MDIYSEVVTQIDLNGNKYEVAIVKEFDILGFVIDVEASKTTPYNLNDNALKFEHNFLITQIIAHAETNALAGFLLKLNGALVPSLSYFLDASNELLTQPLGANSRGFNCTALVKNWINLDLKIGKGEKLQFYVYNTHTSPQELHITLLGYRVFEKILKPIT